MREGGREWDILPCYNDNFEFSVSISKTKLSQYQGCILLKKNAEYFLSKTYYFRML